MTVGKTTKIQGVEVSEDVLNMITTGLAITVHASVLVDNIEKIENHHAVYRHRVKKSLKEAKGLLLNAIIELASDFDLMEKYTAAEEMTRKDLTAVFDRMRKEFYETCIVPEQDRAAFLKVVEQKENDFNQFVSLYKTATDKGKQQVLINLKKNQR